MSLSQVVKRCRKWWRKQELKRIFTKLFSDLKRKGVFEDDMYKYFEGEGYSHSEIEDMILYSKIYGIITLELELLDPDTKKEVRVYKLS